MKIIRGLPAASHRLPVALTIGNFDGVHRGHQALLAQVAAAARARALTPAVMVFEPQPREFFSPSTAPARIANLRDKLSALARHGIERVFVQHFDRRFAAITPSQFVDQVLVAGCQARWLMVGDDFRFGAQRAGDIDFLRARAAAGGYELVQSDTVSHAGERISSSALRRALAAGDLRRAQELLGRPYAISGRVRHGARLGRRIGFPTLNLPLAPPGQPRRPAVHGVFAVRVHGLAAQPLAGVASAGQRPTVDDSGRWLLEVHLFDFAADVYGRLVQVEFVRRLRDEARYADVDALVAAITADAAQARAVLAAPAAGTGCSCRAAS